MLHFISIHENITWLVNPHSYANLREDGDPIAGACMQRHKLVSATLRQHDFSK